jgi:hypothetical protein
VNFALPGGGENQLKMRAPPAPAKIDSPMTVSGYFRLE